VQRFRGGLVFEAHRLVYHSTLGLGVIKKKKKKATPRAAENTRLLSGGGPWRERIFVELRPSDRKLKASREGSK